MRKILLFLTVWMPLLGHAEANWLDLKTQLSAQRFSSVGDLVGAFPHELLGNWTLQPGTESPQWATLDEPRVLMTSDEGRLLVGVAGGPHGESRSRIVEFAQFNDATASYEPHLLILQDNGEVHFIEDAMNYYPRNHPRNCAHCHGEDWRPLYDSYANWRHSYGSGFETEEKHKEYYAFDKFREKNGSSGMYKHLQYLDLANYVVLEEKNTRLNSVLDWNNERRILKYLRNNPIVEKYSQEIMGVLLMANMKFVEFEPQLEKEFIAVETKLSNEISAAIAKNDAEKMRMFGKMIGSRVTNTQMLDKDDVPHYVRLRFLMDKAGISMDEWAMTRERATYSFSDPIQPFTALSALFYQNIFLPLHPEWSSDLKLKRVPRYDGRNSLSDGDGRFFLRPFVAQHLQTTGRPLVNIIDELASHQRPGESEEDQSLPCKKWLTSEEDKAPFQAP